MILKTDGNEFYRALTSTAIDARCLRITQRGRPPEPSRSPIGMWRRWKYLRAGAPLDGSWTPTELQATEGLDLYRHLHAGLQKLYSHYLGEISFALVPMPMLYFRASKYDKGWKRSHTAFDKVAAGLTGTTHEISSLAPDREVLSPLSVAVADLQAWLNTEVYRYFENEGAPDLWYSLSASVGQPLPTENDDLPFSGGEQIAIRNGIVRFRQLVAETYQPTHEQMERIEKKLDHLSDLLSHGLPRTDWTGIAIGAVLHIATILALTPARVQNLAALFQSAVSSVIRLLN
jgi:hypothetical protein